MSGIRYAGIRTAFELLWASRLTGLIRALSKCRGVIFTLHRVVPDRPADFSPNAILQVTPAFLDFAIRRVRSLGLDTVSLDEAISRVEAEGPVRPFAVFTFDDGYRDNLEHALPVLRRLECPFTLYVPTEFADGLGDLWWQGLEDIVAMQKAIAFEHQGEITYLDTASLAQKHEAYNLLYRRIRASSEAERRKLLADVYHRYGHDPAAHCRELIMDWQELQTFGDDPLCTIGSHTVRHPELSKLSPQEVAREIEESVRVLRAQLGVAPMHLSYPYGGAEAAGARDYAIAADLGMRSAVTTRPGGLYAAHRDSLTALPRVSLNGNFQRRRYVEVLATGAVFSTMSGSA